MPFELRCVRDVVLVGGVCHMVLGHVLCDVWTLIEPQQECSQILNQIRTGTTRTASSRAAVPKSSYSNEASTEKPKVEGVESKQAG